ncbi:MAG: alanine--tRNA ligase [Candidatus Magasanikbacteria bacterium RIFCSPLOWO2_02_FULL_44_11]|uniref:Alanine--tRNA ligase n=2 Tax=Candidatus Magasanikiibacteriota TaxID=1752731 RepID=A0A1F6NBZ8_9BACT|nr:MAG: alanine--tRNA ligase [Candidatus Magasanikbacteria bacterium RIFCSPHIGHO2_02_FULL_45_10]OGH81382.1 MAG: alanine--tRNA ligase [Candidatus Magasanikbacteria bacterium RIFCSPLOWO2_02_FULL_44_11]
MSSKELRQKYLDFFKTKGHEILPSASLIPENDPTVLFTTAGMHPLVPFLIGEKHPAGSRLANVQKCVRTGDIDETGDLSHLTFFEMLGNWSLGDYFKKEAIEWSWEFLASPKWLGLDKKKLAVSVFAGDKDAPKDEESAAIWKSLGVPDDRIAYLPKKNNWWGPAGQTGPCGPDTEMFYWKGLAQEFPPAGSNPENDEDNWLEIWNDVFMQYNKTKEGKFESLKQKNVDTGMGLERTLMVLNGKADVFQVDTFWPIIQKIQDITGREYIESKEVTRSMRIVADHIRTATMIIGDDRGIAPSNVDQGYIVRRLIRRAVRHGRLLGLKENFTSHIAEEVIRIFGDIYKEVARNKKFVITEMAAEETKFRDTVEQGLKEFEKLVAGFKIAFEKTGQAVKEISGKQAFKLYDTYGFPLEMTQELAAENNLTVDVTGFNDAFKKHQELSRAGAEQKFAGGLADHSEMSTKYHTATHLLQATLQKVLGPHAIQRGSNITQERLRFDFTQPQKMTAEEIKQTEDLINAAIKKDYPVSWQEMPFEKAKELGAIGLFEDKYQSLVKVYTVGDTKQKAEADPKSATYSREVCGGPHVEHIGTLGKFKIVKEEAVSAGVRRIKAILE